MPLDPDFIRYEEGPAPRAKDLPHASLSCHGYFYLNGLAYDLMGQPEAVEFHYSPKRETIAIANGNPHHPRSFPIVPHRKGFYIHAGSFCGHHRIRPDCTQRFIRPDIDASGCLLLDIRQTVNVTTRRRKPKGKAEGRP